LFVFQKINEHTIHATAYHKVKTHPNVWTTANYNLYIFVSIKPQRTLILLYKSKVTAFLRNPLVY